MDVIKQKQCVAYGSQFAGFKYEPLLRCQEMSSQAFHRKYTKYPLTNKKPT